MQDDEPQFFAASTQALFAEETYRMGYRCIAAEVRLKPLGIIDAVGTGVCALCS